MALPCSTSSTEKDSTAAVSTLDTPPPVNAQYPGKAAMVSLRKPSKTSGPFGPSLESVIVAVGRGGLRTNPDRSTPSGNSLMDNPQGLEV